MADTKISDLTAASALAGADIAPVVQGGANVKATVQQIITAATGATGTNGETVTTSKPRADLTQTWNNVSTTFTGVKFNVTDTASAAASLLMDLQVGGASRFSVSKEGRLAVAGLNNPHSWAYIWGEGAAWNFNAYANQMLSMNGETRALALNANMRLGWTSTGAANTGPYDLILARDAANTLAQLNGVNAQTFRLYNTYTDASNYERGFMRWNTNVLEIGAEAGGTGQSRELKIVGGTQIGVGLTLSAAGSAVMDFISAGSAINLRLSGANANVQSSFSLSWASGSTVTVGNDLRIARSAASVLAINNASTGGGALQVTEMTAPAAPATNSIRIYAEDDGAGKTRLMALFATGAAQQLAIEP